MDYYEALRSGGLQLGSLLVQSGSMNVIVWVRPVRRVILALETKDTNEGDCLATQGQRCSFSSHSYIRQHSGRQIGTWQELRKWNPLGVVNVASSSLIFRAQVLVLPFQSIPLGNHIIFYLLHSGYSSTSYLFFGC